VLIVTAAVLPFVPQLIQVNLWMLCVLVLMLGLLLLVLQYLLRLLLPTVGRWAWRQLLSGLLSPKPLEKKIAKGILAWLVP
jgi:hypothetical protein